MATIVSSNKFRFRQGAMFNLADTGEQILIKRRHKTSYALTPVDIADEKEDDDPEETDEEVEAFFTPEMLAKIDHAMEECRAGTLEIAATFNSHEEIDEYFESRYGIHN